MTKQSPPKITLEVTRNELSMIIGAFEELYEAYRDDTMLIEEEIELQNKLADILLTYDKAGNA